VNIQFFYIDIAFFAFARHQGVLASLIFMVTMMYEQEGVAENAVGG
jgi:hypothetical protein